jgi:hypothetical protein
VIEFISGENISISGNGEKKQITISSTDTNTESTLTITDKSIADTADLVYAVTNLVESGEHGHTIAPTYTGLPTKAYVDNTISALKTETWIFTLENGQEVQKAVYCYNVN